MKKEDLLKALRDPKKRDELTAPKESAAGDILDLDDEALASVSGGCGGPSPFSTPCPPRHCY
ncbi:MAG: mersacidin/lichenicidin family type 2 lantibiotic [Pseudomonadota bacterium]